jgi:hypothetical protein
MLPTMTQKNNPPSQGAGKRGRTPSGLYRARITVGVDLAHVDLSDDGDTVYLEDRATIPPLLEKYAHENGETMPDGLYGFFGDDAEQALKKQINYNFETYQGEEPPIWDMYSHLEFTWSDPDNRPRAATMAWKNPRDLHGAFIRIGRVSGATNDILRFYTGDRRAVDRLTLEPWKVDEYAAVLEQVYGKMRAVIFNALMADDSIQTIVKVYDRRLFEEAGLRPLFRFLSSQDPNQAQAFELPEDDWGGWKLPRNLISNLDKADLMTFIAQPESDKKTREMLTNRRIRSLREENRFPPRHQEIKDVAKRRKQHTSPKGAADDNAGQGYRSKATSDAGEVTNALQAKASQSSIKATAFQH